MPITLQDFERLKFDRKCDVVLCYGQYMMSRTWGKYKIFLYRAHGFFIEVYYLTEQKIVPRLRAFEDVTGLHRYMKVITYTDKGLSVRYTNKKLITRKKKKKPENRWGNLLSDN